MKAVEAPATFEVAAGAATDPGRVRRFNEDAYLVSRPVFLVADGMGGHERGEVASAEAVRQFAALSGRPWVTAADLQQRAAAAASAIKLMAVSGPAPGTTVAGVALTQQFGRPYWLPFNLGDSRVYLQRGDRLEQISVDHSRHQELVDAGADPSSVRVGRNLITRALGAGTPGIPTLDVWLRPVLTGDRVLICSDGLSGELTELLILATLRSHERPGAAAEALIRAALAAGGRDNVTAVVVDAVHVAAGAGDPNLDDDTQTDPDDDTETDPDDDTETERDDTIELSRPVQGANEQEGDDRAGALDTGR